MGLLRAKCPEIARGLSGHCPRTVQLWPRIYTYINEPPNNPLMVLSVINNNLYIYIAIINIVLICCTQDTLKKKSKEKESY